MITKYLWFLTIEARFYQIFRGIIRHRLFVQDDDVFKFEFTMQVDC